MVTSDVLQLAKPSILCLTTISSCDKLGTGSTGVHNCRFDGERPPVPVTIYDVAKEAGVGVGTVSRVLNNNPRVSSETRQRVLQVIERLNFHPSSIAQRLSLRKTLSIGVLAVYFTRPSVVERLRGIESVIADSEYDLMVYNVETPSRRDECFRSTASSSRVDGLIVISLAPADEDVGRWASAGVPVVLVDTLHPTLPCIIVDDISGGYKATEHLIKLGHTRIGFIGDPIHTAFNFRSSRDRFEGMCRALKDHGLAFDPAFHQAGEHGRESARVLTHRLLDLDDSPTAIFAASDTQAFGVLQAAKERGIQVPQELSVVGYDDVEMSEYLNLTTVHQPLFDSGLRSVDLLLHSIDTSDPAPVREQLPVHVIERSTTARPKN
ncbi:MAG: LacI family DNA-binding transcriptional regulator [Anaerolineales bacterium]|nr:LacI family DNA-binding transcriptional regulator [Anaerolineales bacterium]MCO5243165.1 LacI family transcriptional regulator [Anaerolineae bacterium]